MWLTEHEIQRATCMYLAPCSKVCTVAQHAKHIPIYLYMYKELYTCFTNGPVHVRCTTNGKVWNWGCTYYSYLDTIPPHMSTQKVIYSATPSLYPAYTLRSFQPGHLTNQDTIFSYKSVLITEALLHLWEHAQCTCTCTCNVHVHVLGICVRRNEAINRPPGDSPSSWARGCLGSQYLFPAVFLQ